MRRGAGQPGANAPSNGSHLSKEDRMAYEPITLDDVLATRARTTRAMTIPVVADAATYLAMESLGYSQADIRDELIREGRNG